MTDPKTLHEAARETVDAIATEDMRLIKRAGKSLQAALELDKAKRTKSTGSKLNGRPASFTDEQLAQWDHLPTAEAAKMLGVHSVTVTRRRKARKAIEE